MVKNIKYSLRALVILGSLGIGWGQQASTYYPVWSNKTSAFLGTFVIPPAKMIGQFTHQLSITVADSGGTCVQNSPDIILEGSYNNTVWQAIGTPLSAFTRNTGTGIYTGITVGYGAYPFLRVNSLRASFTSNCIVNLAYGGNVTPVSMPTSLPMFGTQYVSWGHTLTGTGKSILAQCTGQGCKIAIGGLTLSNNDAATPTTLTLSVYNTPGATPCDDSGSGSHSNIHNFTLPASTTLSIGYNNIPIISAPSPDCSGGGACNDTYNATTGFFQVCIQSSANVAYSASYAYIQQ